MMKKTILLLVCLCADMTYSYDQMHGWLTGIQSSTGFEQRLYRETEGNVPCYSGNISAMTWKTNNTYLRRFDYRYNGMNWLKNADFSYYTISGGAGQSPTLSLVPYVGVDHEDYTCEYYYDKNGNITGAYRQGLVDNLEYEYGLSYDTMDDYNVEYHGNQKTAVNGSGTGSPSYYGSSSFVDGVENGSNEYAYDANGAMTKDLNKGISSISYDLLGNLKTITQTGNRSISYVYSADGTRLKTVHSKKVGSAYVKDSTEYCGSLVLKNGKPGMFLFPGGYYSFSTSGLLNSCHYYIQDYLGSNRMVVNKSGAVEQITHYYPYGGVIGGIDNTPNLQPYKFEGMEFDRTYGLDWYDIHARQYDPVVPSWHKMDPLAEKYYWLSPYAYCINNPVNSIDIDGRSVWTKLVKAGWKVGKTVAKNGLKSLSQAETYLNAASDIIDDINTLSNDNATVTDKIEAGLSLASEALPISVSDLKDLGKAASIIGGTITDNKKLLGRSGTTIARKNGITIKTYGTNDAHKPAHAHVIGKGKEIRIGANGKPLKGEGELSTAQKKVVKDNKKEIRKEVNAIGKENKKIEDEDKFE